MQIKDILGLFFKYPVKGFPVIDDRDEALLGVMAKDKLVELSSNGSNLDLSLAENRSRVVQKLDADLVRLMFGGLESHTAIPVLNYAGEIRKVMTRSDLLSVLEVKERPVPSAPVPAASAATAEEKPSQDTAVSADPFAVLDLLKVPVLLTGKDWVVRFANGIFLETFNFEKDFILNQKVGRFFKDVKLDSRPQSGNISYQHKKWHYRISYADDLVSIVFLEVKESPAPSPVVQDAEKILKGKMNLKASVEIYENALIKKVHQKLKETAASARRLGISEEALKYRLQKMKG